MAITVPGFITEITATGDCCGLRGPADGNGEGAAGAGANADTGVGEGPLDIVMVADGIGADDVDDDWVTAFVMPERMSLIVCCKGGANPGCVGNDEVAAGAARVSKTGPMMEDDVTFTKLPEGFGSVRFISARLYPAVAKFS